MTVVKPSKIDLAIEYRNPTPSHCDVAVWVNAALAGTLRLRQEELLTFQDILLHGISDRCGDTFVARGSPEVSGPRARPGED